jgi:hypothetical protein
VQQPIAKRANLHSGGLGLTGLFVAEPDYGGGHEQAVVVELDLALENSQGASP